MRHARAQDLVALMVNLAAHARAAEARTALPALGDGWLNRFNTDLTPHQLQVIVQSGLFPAIVLRVLKHRDPLLCKVRPSPLRLPLPLRILRSFHPSLGVKSCFTIHATGDTTCGIPPGCPGTNVRTAAERGCPVLRCIQMCHLKGTY